ncbi:MBL fold metallo-hydrolase [Roseovarius sp. EL26]|uniref:MBL fold metallo-hydrolase n=1 Tax=Roseovarius sp. EL26 TaxID=2126672 RepID=UPI000EA381FB|nr:MBL fold metallo-hydrolase [Roseovarius sp. EL26]
MLLKVGNVEVWRILEINGPFKPAEELFPTAGPELHAVLNAHAPDQLCPDSGKLIIPIQGFLLKTSSHIILVDACVGNDKINHGTADWNKRSDTRFMAALTAAGVTPDDIDYVLCTHLHADHVGWNTRLVDGRWVPTFPNAKYLLPDADNDHYAANPNDTYQESVLPVIAAGQAELVTADHKLGDYVTLIPTPGHTPGHVSVLIKDGASEALITGDAIHTTAQCHRPDWHFRYDMDPELAVVSRRALLENVSEKGCKILGTHFTLPSTGRVRANGDTFKWEAD